MLDWATATHDLRELLASLATLAKLELLCDVRNSGVGDVALRANVEKEGATNRRSLFCGRMLAATQ